MSDDRWIVIPRWTGPDGFQHYAERDPIWIKNYRSLLHSDEYRSLSFVQRGILHGIWLEYAASNRQLRDSTLTLTRQLGQRVTRASLDRLSDAGFIEFSASKPLAERYPSRASREEETEREKKEPPNPPPDGGGNQLEDEEREIDPLRCKRCGARVKPRSTCKACGATSKQAGTNPRALEKPSAYERAKTFTLNVGRQYETPDFLDELSRLELTDEQRDSLLVLRANGSTSDESNPFIDE